MPSFAGGWTRSMTPAMATFLSGGSLTLALLVQVVRLDSVTFGFTDHDRDITYNGVTYEALSGVSASALRQEAIGGVDNMDVIGMLQSVSITETDLRAGRYDGAAVTMYVVNWADLTMGSILLHRGVIGAVTLTDGQYKAEFRSLMQRMQQTIGELTSPLCRVHALGDSRCKISLTPYQFARTVSVASDPDMRQMTFGSDASASGYYNFGRVIWTSGQNSGLVSEVKTHTNVSGAAQIVLQLPLAFPANVGDGATLEAGCDRKLSTCQSKFSNVVNFRGEPTVPGTDQLLAVGRPPGS